MNLDGNFLLAASQQEVWDKLNNTEVLKQCIPGCEALDEISENSFQATIRAKVGPVNAKFKSVINLQDINEPESYVLSVKSKGGAAGMGEGLARVNLIEQEDNTRLEYSVEFKVQGKLAQIGSRLIMNVIQKLSNEFFSKFVECFPAMPDSAKASE
jgi:carbon monoxide dehydrogenase subunit G